MVVRVFDSTVTGNGVSVTNSDVFNIGRSHNRQGTDSDVRYSIWSLNRLGTNSDVRDKILM